jgi:hypothetical protein
MAIRPVDHGIMAAQGGGVPLTVEEILREIRGVA